LYRKKKQFLKGKKLSGRIEENNDNGGESIETDTAVEKQALSLFSLS
jgi:hypothetical protein